MRTKLVLPLVLCLGMMLLAGPQTYAGELDILVDKLVQKGILTRPEADEVLAETKAEVAREIKDVSHPTLPKWLQKTKIKGDLRLRHQYERRVNDTDARNRGRVRYRLGIETKIVDKVKVQAGIASGSDDPRSTNQTFENTFDSPDIRLDYANVEYSPADWAKIIGGKFNKKGYLWAPTDLLWDTDINPEGGSLHLEHELVKNTKGFLNTGIWVIDENGKIDRPDPYLTYVQGGAKWKDGDLDAKVATTYYGFHGVKGTDLDNENNTNTQVGGAADAGLQFDYDSIGVSAEVGVKEPCGLPVPRVAVFGDYIHNVDPSDDENGFAVGVKVGDKKVAEKGDWQAKYIYARLGKDAFPDTFPDSDRYSGNTDVKSHETIVQYGLNKNVIFEIDYYQNQRIKAAKNLEHLLQTSAIFKF